MTTVLSWRLSWRRTLRMADVESRPHACFFFRKDTLPQHCCLKCKAFTGAVFDIGADGLHMGTRPGYRADTDVSNAAEGWNLPRAEKCERPNQASEVHYEQNDEMVEGIERGEEYSRVSISRRYFVVAPPSVAVHLSVEL